MSEEPKYELRKTEDDGGKGIVICDTWDEAAEAAIGFGWGHWETPAEFVLIEGATIKATRS